MEHSSYSFKQQTVSQTVSQAVSQSIEVPYGPQTRSFMVFYHCYRLLMLNKSFNAVRWWLLFVTLPTWQTSSLPVHLAIVFSKGGTIQLLTQYPKSRESCILHTYSFQSTVTWYPFSYCSHVPINIWTCV